MPTIRVALGSGALKGAYQYGFFKTLENLDASRKAIKYDRVYGTSIGSVNAPFIATKNAHKMGPIWDAHDPLHRAMKKDCINHILYPLEKPAQCLLSVATRGYWYESFDTKVLETLWYQADLTYALSLPTAPEVGCVTYNVDDECEEWIPTNDFPLYIQSIQKSAAIPPLFPYCIRDGKWYIDGGITEDVPTTNLISPDFDGIYILIDNGIDLDRNFSDDIPLLGQYDKMLSIARRFIRKEDKQRASALPKDRT